MKKAARWAWIISLVAATGAGLVLAFMLAIIEQQPRAVRAALRVAVLAERRGRDAARAGHRLRRGAAGEESAQRQVRQSVAVQAGRHLRAGRRGARRADLHGVVSVRLAQHRDLVRRARGRRARRRAEPRSQHARCARQRPRGENAHCGRAARRVAHAAAAARARTAARTAFRRRSGGARTGGAGAADRRWQRPCHRTAERHAAAPGAHQSCRQSARGARGRRAGGAEPECTGARIGGDPEQRHHAR